MKTFLIYILYISYCVCASWLDPVKFTNFECTHYYSFVSSLTF